MKKIILLLLSMFVFPMLSFAGNADDPFVLIPDVEDTNQGYGADVAELGQKKSSKKFRHIYNAKADSYGDDVGAQMASGIINRDTILLLLGRVVKFLANGALVVGAAMIIYAGYLYIASVFAGDYTSQANEAIKWAFIGIVIVIFSYAIIRMVIHAFL